MKLFTGRATTVLSEKISEAYGQALGKLKVLEFSDGELQPVFEESVRGGNIFLIQSTFSPADNLMELLLMIDAVKRASASYITVVIPFFGYARQDRKDRPRVSIGAKLVANLLETAGANRIMTMDLHSDQIQGFFNIPVDHLKSEAIFMPHLEQKDMTNTVFACPDVGGVTEARSYAKYFQTELVICDKHRQKANAIASMTLIGDVKGMDVIIIDDIIDTGGTLCRAAKLIMEHGAKSVQAFCTHPVLSGEAIQRIQASSLASLTVSDTIPFKQASSKIKTISCSALFAEAIYRVEQNRSIEALFSKRGR